MFPRDAFNGRLFVKTDTRPTPRWARIASAPGWTSAIDSDQHAVMREWRDQSECPKAPTNLTSPVMAILRSPAGYASPLPSIDAPLLCIATR